MNKAIKIKDEDLIYAENKIDYWNKKNIRLLTIITVPFNTPCIFIEMIKKVATIDGKILYVWGRSRENKALVSGLKESNSKVTHSYVKEGKTSTNLTFVNYKNIKQINEKFDLLIFDDVTYFSELSMNKVNEYLYTCMDLSKKVIFYGIEKSALIGEKFELAAYDYKKLFVEPRIITTRIDLNIDIPYSLYDYIKWFNDNNDKVLICVPSEEKADKIYEYFKNKLKSSLSDIKIIKSINKNEIKLCERVLKYKDKAIFIVTNNFEELLEYCSVNHVIVLFSDDEKFTYKKLLFLCGKVRIMSDGIREIIFVSNNISYDMEKSKNMAREFSKKVWEKNLIKLKEH